MCVEKKDGAVRICLDPKDLNKVVKREYYRIPTMKDIPVKFFGPYSILDMTHGYWHIDSADDSGLLTTFNIPFGRCCSKRSPLEVHSAAEVL